MPNVADDQVSILKRDLEKLLLISGAYKYFDLNYYLASNEDVRLEVEAGLTSGLVHFLKHGFLEGRAPFRIKVDEEYYLRNNPDVVEAIREGRCESAQWHFDTHGRREGRAPYELQGKERLMSSAGRFSLRDRFQLVRSAKL